MRDGPSIWDTNPFFGPLFILDDGEIVGGRGLRCEGRLGGGMRERGERFDGADDDEFACVCAKFCVWTGSKFRSSLLI